MSRVWGGAEVRAGGRASRWGGPWRPAEHGEVRTTFLCASGSPSRRRRVCVCSAERVADVGWRQVTAGQPVMATALWPRHREQRAPRPQVRSPPGSICRRRHGFLIAGGLAAAVGVRTGVGPVLVSTALAWKAVAVAYGLHGASPGTMAKHSGDCAHRILRLWGPGLSFAL